MQGEVLVLPSKFLLLFDGLGCQLLFLPKSRLKENIDVHNLLTNQKDKAQKIINNKWKACIGFCSFRKWLTFF